MNEMSESELCSLVRVQLENGGCDTRCEVRMGRYRSDMIVVKNGVVTAVEFKQNFDSQAIQQVKHFKTCADYGVVCTRGVPREESGFTCWKRGVGLWHICPYTGKVVEDEKPRRNDVIQKDKDRLLEAFYKTPHDLSGGVRSGDFDGAERTVELVTRYVAGNPEASWSDVFRDVPNSYSSVGSMTAAVRQCAAVRGIALPRIGKQGRR